MSDRDENIASFIEMCAEHQVLAMSPQRHVTRQEANTLHAAISSLALGVAMLLQLAPELDDE